MACQDKTIKIMHYTYVLKSQKDQKYYIGSTANIENRL